MRIIIIGSGGHAQVIIEAIRARGEDEIEGLLDDFRPDGEWMFGYEVLGKVDQVERWPHLKAFIAVGDNLGRHDISVRIWSRCNLNVSVIHPRAFVAAGAEIEKGAFIAAGACIGAGATVGKHSIVNTNASLDHDSVIGHFSHLAPGAVTAGMVKIGHRTMIGVGAMIRDGVTIGNDCTIGMGSVVIKDVPDNSVGWGNPFKIQK